MITPRMQALQNLSGQLPVASQRIATGQKAARDIQLQQAVQAAPSTTQIAPVSQQLGAAMAQQTSEQAVQTAGQQVQAQGQIGQMGLAEQQRQQQSELASQQLGARQEEMDMATEFGKLNQELKQKMYDATMKFEQDELGRTKLNEMQMADFAVSNARSEEQFRNYAQAAEQANKRKLQMMEHAYRMVTADLEQKQREAEQRRDFQTTKRIAQIKSEAAAAMQRERDRAANRNAAWQAGGTIIGAGIGAWAGGPTGAMTGGQAGGGLGSAAGTMFGGG